MDINEARDIVEDFGVEEGGKYRYDDVMVLEVTEIKENSAGIREVHYEVGALDEGNDQTSEGFDVVDGFAKKIRGGFLEPMEE